MQVEENKIQIEFKMLPEHLWYGLLGIILHFQ